jgi:hypothetical protein
MIYASSKDAIKKKLTGIKHELQATCYEEVKDRCTLAEKLGGQCCHLPGWQAFVSPLQPPAWSIWQPQTCPWGMQAAPFLPDPRGWGVSQQGESNSFTPVAKQPPHPLDLPPPSIPDGSGFPKLLLIF